MTEISLDKIISRSPRVVHCGCNYAYDFIYIHLAVYGMMMFKEL